MGSGSNVGSGVGSVVGCTVGLAAGGMAVVSGIGVGSSNALYWSAMA